MILGRMVTNMLTEFRISEVLGVKMQMILCVMPLAVVLTLKLDKIG